MSMGCHKEADETQTMLEQYSAEFKERLRSGA
jgi:hypothetical protein